MSSPVHLDAAAIEALVAEVIRRIRSDQAAAPTAAPAHHAAAAPVTAPSAYPIGERVVTLASVERLPPGVRRATLVGNAVITPSAADRARELGLELVRGGQTPPAATVRPFVIAQAACRGDASARASAIARAVPGSQQLPASGLAEVIAAFAAHASRDAARGILLTGRPAVAVVLANRSASLRAVTGRDAAAVAAAAADAAANLLVLDPAVFPGGSLERIGAEFQRASATALPPELATAAAGCGCKTHSGGGTG